MQSFLCHIKVRLACADNQCSEDSANIYSHNKESMYMCNLPSFWSCFGKEWYLKLFAQLGKQADLFLTGTQCACQYYLISLMHTHTGTYDAHLMLRLGKSLPNVNIRQLPNLNIRRLPFDLI